MGTRDDNKEGCTAESGDIQRALAALPLPIRPVGEAIRSHENDANQSRTNEMILLPCIFVLVCADFDLKSSSALAEYALQQKDEIFDAKSIDLIIAVGPSTGGTEMLNYYQGRKRSKHQHYHKIRHNRHQHSNLEHHHLDLSYDKDTDVQNGNDVTHSTSPFFRTREESAALEGLMTAALSQLESIVCRVVYCPGWHDPLSVLQPSSNMKRLTPNSRNVHQQWLPIAPGLGCAGLFYVDHTDQLIEQYKMNRCEIDSNTNSSQDHMHNQNEEDDGSEVSGQGDCSAMLADQVKKLKQLYVYIYTDTLFNRLISFWRVVIRRWSRTFFESHTINLLIPMVQYHIYVVHVIETLYTVLVDIIQP
jgi:hypothetical protein